MYRSSSHSSMQDAARPYARPRAIEIWVTPPPSSRKGQSFIGLDNRVSSIGSPLPESDCSDGDGDAAFSEDERPNSQEPPAPTKHTSVTEDPVDHIQALFGPLPPDCVRQNGSGHQSTKAPGTDVVTTHRQDGSGRTSKRRRLTPSENSDEEHDDDETPKKQKQTKGASGSDLMLACPFHKHDRSKFQGKCCFPGWPDVHRLK